MSLDLDERQRAMLSAMGIDWPQLLAPALAPQAVHIVEPTSPAIDTMQPGVRSMTLGQIKQLKADETPFKTQKSDANQPFSQEKRAQAATENIANTTSEALTQTPRIINALGAVVENIAPDSCLLLIDHASSPMQVMHADALTLLGNILQAVTLPAEKVLISSIVAGQERVADEVGAAAVRQQWQTRLTQTPPALLVLMGRITLRSLLQSSEPLGKLRAASQQFAERPAVVSYPPDYLLRNPLDKAKAWHDWLRIKQMMENSHG